MENTFGIDDIAFKAPSLYLPIQDLAEQRGIDPNKLTKGLGLTNMSMCDVDEDIVTLSAASVIKLLQQNPDIKPEDIGRIYVGTESSIDGAKPIGTYIHQLVSDYFEAQHVDTSKMKHVDVIDMTFACIGAVDAMHNSLYYLYAEPDKVAIVVAADIANYDLASPGEYTQGAGALSVLLKKNPSLVQVGKKWGTSVKSEHDFFKPIRYQMQNNEIIELHDEKPVFDGQFSNDTYQNRIAEAWEQFSTEESLSDYEQLLFHLPYAYHGRRIISSIKQKELVEQGTFETVCKENDIDPNDEQVSRLFGKTPYYKNWVKETIAAGDRLSSEMGNLYTASIFLSLLSYCTSSQIAEGNTVLFFAYGSGSKAKVFEGTIAAGFAAKAALWRVDEVLAQRKQVTFDEYISLRSKKVETPLSEQNEIIQVASGVSPTNKFERTYTFKSK